MLNALWITLVGMGMVFLVILFLWGLMALLVRLTAEAPVQPPPIAPDIQPPAEPARDSSRAGDNLRLAAAAAVAVALARRAASPPHPPELPVPPASGSISPWLAVHRAGLFAQRANPPRRR